MQPSGPGEHPRPHQTALCRENVARSLALTGDEPLSALIQTDAHGMNSAAAVLEAHCPRFTLGMVLPSSVHSHSCGRA